MTNKANLKVGFSRVWVLATLVWLAIRIPDDYQAWSTWQQATQLARSVGFSPQQNKGKKYRPNFLEKLGSDLIKAGEQEIKRQIAVTAIMPIGFGIILFLGVWVVEGFSRRDDKIHEENRERIEPRL